MTDSPKIDFIVCQRVENLPVPLCPATQRLCDQCGALVWVALKTLAAVTAPTYCLVCATEMAPDVPKVIQEFFSGKGDQIAKVHGKSDA